MDLQISKEVWDELSPQEQALYLKLKADEENEIAAHKSNIDNIESSLDRLLKSGKDDLNASLNTTITNEAIEEIKVEFRHLLPKYAPNWIVAFVRALAKRFHL